FLDFLPADKAQQCLELEEQFAKMRAELSQSSSSAEEKQRQFKAMTENQDHQVASLLSADELQEYKLRGSGFASLRNQLPGFEASPAEMHSIATVLEKRPNARPGTPDGTQLSTELAAIVGADRVAEYERAHDTRYQQSYAFADRLDLSPDVATTVYQMQVAAETAAQDVRHQTSTEAEKRTLLEAIRIETSRSVGEVLGAQAFSVYQSARGQWMDALLSL